jgi:hypothetical protein
LDIRVQLSPSTAIPSRRFAIPVAVLGLTLACIPDLSVPPEAEILCATGEPCPGGLVCSPGGRCVDPSALDVEAPGLAGPPRVSPEVGGAGEVFTVDLDTTKDLVRAPDVVLSATGAPMACEQRVDRAFRCTYVASGEENAGLGGTMPFDVTLRDAAGNVTVLHQAGVLRLDFQPPVLAGASVTPPEAKLGTRIQVFFTPSEPVRTPVVLRATPALDRGDGGFVEAFDVDPSPGTLNFLFEHVVTAGDEAAEIAFTLELVDLAGNRSGDLEVGRVIVDNRVPQLQDATVSHAHIRPGQTLEVTFTTTRPLDGQPEVSLGAQHLDADPSVTAPSHRFTRIIDAEDEEGPRPVLVVGRDGVGHEVFESLGVVVVDATAPAVVPGTESLVLVPGEGNPLLSVRRARAGTLARVAFSLDEPVVGDPVVWAQGPGELAFERRGEGSAMVYERVVTGADPEGSYTLHVLATDLAGNAEPAQIEGVILEVHHTPPPSPDVDAPGAFVHHRIPWGASSTGGVPAFGVAARAGALPSGSTLLVLDGPDVAVATELGRAAVESTAALEVPLMRSDRPVVYLALADDAGNVSPAVAARDGTWTATLGGKRPGSTLENPTVLTMTPRFRPTRAQDAVRASEPPPEALALPGGEPAIRLAEATWQRWVADPTLPGEREGYGLAYDPIHGNVFLFGGQDGVLTPLQDTWIWRGESGVWSQLATQSPPAPRRYMAMAFDPRRGVLLLHGGNRYLGETYGDLFELDPRTLHWRELTQEGDVPGPRRGHSMVYDASRDRMVLYGSLSDPDVYEWDGRRWWRRAAPEPRPEPRAYGAVAYDADRQRVVLFGGQQSGGVYVDDTWEWDGHAGVWIERPAAERPSARTGHAMGWDPGSGEMVMMGGSPSGHLADTWRWDPSSGTWSLHEQENGPSGRRQHGMVLDVVRGHLLLFGALFGVDTWQWDGHRWSDRTPNGLEPAPRAGAMMAPMGEGAVVLFGGLGEGGALDDTWIWDGVSRRWRLQAPDGARPEARAFGSLAFDPIRSRAVLFGGDAWDVGFPDDPLLDDLWEWDGGAWSERTATGPVPPARHAASMAWAGDGRMLLQGGWDAAGDLLADTWTLDAESGAWTERAPLTDPSLAGFAVWDALREVVVALIEFFVDGTSTRRFGAWTWDPVALLWDEPETTSPEPPGRIDHAAAFDEARGRIFLFGGQRFSPIYVFDDLWSLDPEGRWVHEVTGGPKPSPRHHHVMAADDVHGTIVLHGGLSSEMLGDTWILEPGADARPAAVWTVPWTAAGLDHAAIEDVAIQLRAGGRGHGPPSDPVPDDGFVLGAWEGARWLPLASVLGVPGGDVPAIADLGWTASEASFEASRLFTGRPESLYLSVTPRAPSGGGPEAAALHLDYLEATVSYRRP